MAANITIRSVELRPNPVLAGEAFTISVEIGRPPECPYGCGRRPAGRCRRGADVDPGGSCGTGRP